MDDTHGTNSYDFSLITFLVVDEYGESFPAACAIEHNLRILITMYILINIRRLSNGSMD